MKLTMLGTGHAVVTNCFNTCFLLDDNGPDGAAGDGDSVRGRLFLTDTGGGNMLLNRIKEAGYSWNDIHDVFISHRHTDHLLGVFWLIRMAFTALGRAAQKGQDVSSAGLRIWSHAEVIDIIRQTVLLLFPERQTAFLDHGLDLITVSDGEEQMIGGHRFTFFDTCSTKDTQFGYRMDLGDGQTLTFCGDEPLQECCFGYGQDSTWLLHEAFCISPDAFGGMDPRKIGHSTVRDACLLAEQLGVSNLILYHTEDSDMANRKRLYTEEGRKYYSGRLLVPDDLETILL